MPARLAARNRIGVVELSRGMRNHNRLLSFIVKRNVSNLFHCAGARPALFSETVALQSVASAFHLYLSINKQFI